VDRLLASCKEKLGGDEDAFAAVARAKEVLVAKELVSPDIIASLTLEQLTGAGMRLGAAAALKKAFPSAGALRSNGLRG
jgi:hypothetical protein